jgi:hypothetical protein
VHLEKKIVDMKNELVNSYTHHPRIYIKNTFRGFGTGRKARFEG